MQVRLSLVFALLFFQNILFAQAVDIRGTIADSATGEKIPYANVILIGTGRGVASNLQGFYLITSVPPGRYQISASTIGHRASVKTIEVRTGSPMIVNFELAAKAVQMSEVTVTAGARREISDVYTSSHVLDQRDIKAVPVAAQEDVFRSISILPGITSTSLGENAGKSLAGCPKDQERSHEQIERNGGISGFHFRNARLARFQKLC